MWRNCWGRTPHFTGKTWHQIMGWYKAAVDCTPPPARVTLERITAERVELYIYVPPPRTKIPISMQQFLMEDSMPTEDKIEWVVTLLYNHCSGGESGIQEEHLKRWLVEARKSEKYVMITAKA